ncbi:protein of unknown function (DUF4345) [Streptoalloteichus tenebrarius]|uniref:DUF4345 domain-containing protein n=1 Tax=Streptoalloteichus tenebrarius (strain ATCC 17920 / DSM 40477 / JCM 4838 / CBS 697.72 / NBRC 16177 / NCIMB 11028 / NRRL B-12390 / A12253. 1 / ISP 5477) TaxID=1933 RepID=A0ABT1HLE2_STRSD|nr:DUF4345 domain-containing protein [Streptoalloteichus tenebrarius]MCP2256331.1 protein of unknown function (DUF4345) [Streptoalloteichus tenebrarius]BFF04670.1 hypothetical protein GCM10020241_63450 [Streptoalloteichus tenebrarius]
MARFLRGLMLAMGVACVLIGAAHLALGIDSVPGEGWTGATVDSRERFYNAIFLGYGLAWIWAARRSPIPASAVRWLAGIFLLGAVGRLLSMVVYGQPHWFQVVLTVIEVLLPPVFFWLATADEKAAASARAARGPVTHQARPVSPSA